MRAKVATVGVAAAITLAGCGSGHSYPANVQTNFLNACEAAGGSVARCGCALSYIEARVSINAYQVAERAIEAGDTNYPSWYTNAATSCQNK